MNNDEPRTREEWLENNRLICEAEGEPPEVIFRNQIETRLRQPWLMTEHGSRITDEDDERLGDAYIACLAQYEYEPDAVALNEPWAPLTAAHLVFFKKITLEEAEVIVAMAAEEYPNRV